MGEGVRRLDSGNPELDLILGGGFPVNSTNLVAGMPGAGKTILAQSIVFRVATPQTPALYVGTVSEPLDRMLRYVQEFDFFDDGLIGDAVIYADLSEVLRSEGLVAAVREVVDLIKQHRPAYLVIDSFKALHALAASPKEFREQLSILSSVLSALAMTSFLIGEYSLDEVAELPEFAVADSIVELVMKKIGVRDVRYLRVIKERGSAFLSGEHAFRITGNGVELFPRLTSQAVGIDYKLVEARDRTGVPALDAMLHEGLWKGSSTLVFGPPGSGKTLLGLHFIFKGIEAGEKGIIATMQENPTQLQRIVRGFGWDLEAAIASGMLTLMYVSPVESFIDEFVSQLSRRVRVEGTQRVLIDSVNDLLRASGDVSHFHDFMYSLGQSLAVNGVSSIMTHEVAELFGASILSRHGISHMSDNVLLLSYLRHAARITRTLAVIKTRASGHDEVVREFTISSQGLLVGGPVGTEC